VRKHLHASLVALLLLGVSAPALAQSAPRKYFSAASTNSTLVRTGRNLVRVLLPVNTTAVLYYLKLYDKATAPTCGTDVPVFVVPVPTTGTAGQGGGVALPMDNGLQFNNGVGFCLTSGIADNDTGVAAVGVVINIALSGF
jgi:hypothetical protein